MCIFQKKKIIIPLKTSTAVDVLLFKIPAFLESLFFPDPFGAVTENNVTEDREKDGDCPADVSKCSLWKGRCDDNVDRRKRCTTVLHLGIPDVFSDDEKRNTAMRREACSRSCSTLRIQRVSATLSRMYAWHGYDDVSTAHRRIYGSDRLVPPRLRRAAYLLTEYHRDSYIAAIVVHTPATGMTCCGRIRGSGCFEMNPEARSRSHVSSSNSHGELRWRSADRDRRSAISKPCNCQSANLSFSRFSPFDRFIQVKSCSQV